MFKYSHFSQFLRVFNFENTPTNKDMFKVDDARASSTPQLKLFGCLLIGLWNIFWILWRRLFLIKLQAFNINSSGGVCFYLQAVMESVLVKIEAFTMNGSDGVYDGACFYLHGVVVCF